MTDDEKRHRRHARRAAKETAKERAEAGLFVALVKPTTPADEWRRWRRNVANAAEAVAGLIGDQGQRGLAWIELHAIERLAASLMPTEDFEKVRAYIRRTYPMPDYGHSVWHGVMTGKRVVTRIAKVMNPPGSVPECRLIEADVYSYVHMTSEEFWRLFPYKFPHPEQPDDGGLADRLAALFTPATQEGRTDADLDRLPIGEIPAPAQ